jgi:HTH-type transcriptional regulator / antitoxin HigA
MGSENTSLIPAVVPHPGEFVSEYLEFNGWSQRDLARRTGLTPKTISEICNGKAPISPTTSLALEKSFQRPASFWLNLQRQYDEAAARRHEVAKTQGWTEWAKKFPIKDMRRLHLLPSGPAKRSDVEDLLSFLGVASPDSWSAVWSASGVALRQSQLFSKSAEAIAVWIRATEIEAGKLSVPDFDEVLLRNSLETLRGYTRLPADQIMEPIQAMCAKAGLAVVWVPELKKTGISGCARWLTDRKALIGLSLRYKTDDQMWFTLFHEIGHLLLHRRQNAFIVDTGEVYSSERNVDPEMQRLEEEASRFAADTLIPPRALAEFTAQKTYTNHSIHDFAEEINIGPGIVVGRLQFEGILAPFQGNALKQKLGFGFEGEA